MLSIRPSPTTSLLAAAALHYAAIIGSFFSGTVLCGFLIQDSTQRMLWQEFIRSHLETLAAVDFFTAEVWTAGGLTTYYVLVFMRIASRQINIAGITLAPEGEW